MKTRPSKCFGPGSSPRTLGSNLADQHGREFYSWFCTSEMLCMRWFLPRGSEGRVNALGICKSTLRDA